MKSTKGWILFEIFQTIRSKIKYMPEEKFYKMILILVYLIGLVYLILKKHGYI